MRRALAAGAVAAPAGTRFLHAEESRAHPGYRQRLLAAEDTFVTEFFGAGRPAPHRVVANAATARRLDRRGRPALVNRTLKHLLAPGARYTPDRVMRRIIGAQRPGGRLLSPTPPTDDGRAALLDVGPLYAGETVARIATVEPATDLVGALTLVPPRPAPRRRTAALLGVELARMVAAVGVRDRARMGQVASAASSSPPPCRHQPPPWWRAR